MTRPMTMNLRLLVALVYCATSLAAAPKPPNFVFLLVDDLRWNALGFMGDKIVQTPHLDRLAAKSVVFDNCFVTTSICSVSRASYFTGQWMRRHGIVDFATGLNGAAWGDTYPAKLRAAGFRTGFIGKWGVGSPKETEAKAAAFDYWKGLPGQAGEFIEKNDPTRTHKTARFGNEALEFLGGCTKDKPFCLSLSFNAVHARDGKPREFEPDPRDEALYANVTIPVPKLATDEAFRRLPEAVQKSEGRKRWGWRFDTPEKTQQILRDYYRLITGVDREVGRIVAELEQRGLADNTVIVFTADNGFALGDRGMADKWFMYEEDIRVPAFIFDPRAPKAVQGRRSKAMALNVDFAPTLLELAGVPVPPMMQGRSLVPLVRGAVPNDWRTEFFYEHHSVAARIPMSEGVRTERWKYLRWIAETPVKEELYDLQADPLEERSLLADPKHAALLAELRGKWERYGRELK
jgi:arylsulfatase A-like enzyme